MRILVKIGAGFVSESILTRYQVMEEENILLLTGFNIADGQTGRQRMGVVNLFLIE